MKQIKIIAVLLLTLLTISSCGPIYGQLMRVSEGIKSFEVESGDIKDLNPSMNLLVLGPFADEEEYYFVDADNKGSLFPLNSSAKQVCQGEDALDFSKAFNKARVFNPEHYMLKDPGKLDSEISELRTKSADSIKSELALGAKPDIILFGTLISKEKHISPLRGVVISAKYKLEFYNISAHKSTIVNVSVKELNEKYIHDIVNTFDKKLKKS